MFNEFFLKSFFYANAYVKEIKVPVFDVVLSRFPLRGHL